ncbi:serine/threonine protein kinase AktR, putative [Toxoplasma gondii ME49]|uniref:AGC kinase n=2 Tax=Toxoplasma gondii TaxID=5811 RepID=A0A0F7UXU6_TOXGV|nr:serine/threonine protein kinase AktR, putative [Toxoplasma gondii ME49]EPT28743.1 serine/threonine protein kinase AktR, putative [Toxoplasma gondii ME49]ESS36087.1 putative serine/threonine protein kinase AktR [Toxoplasma gondii VEG]CEL75027.1 TPA: AGC kinase [Toxoplasma gondii VEG]|eukprot:XP_018636768.1 serine/threonine protein kinase AktR, putative [Toxoplasma gondii ME49]
MSSAARLGLSGQRGLSPRYSSLTHTAGKARRVPKNVRLFHIEGRGARLRIVAEHPDEETTGWLLARAIEGLAEKGLGDGLVALRTDPSGPLGNRDWVDVYLQDMHRTLGCLPFEDYLQCVYSEPTGPPEGNLAPRRENTAGAKLSESIESPGGKADRTINLRASKAASRQNSPSGTRAAVKDKSREGTSSELRRRNTASSMKAEPVGDSSTAVVAVGGNTAGTIVAHASPPSSPLALSALETPHHESGAGYETWVHKGQSDHEKQGVLERNSETTRQVATRTYTRFPRSGGVSVRDFREEGVIGQGGFSVVYKVRKKDTGRLYALKVVAKNKIAHEPNKIRRALSERDVLKQCDSPFVVRLFWAFQSENHLFLVNELCPGGDLFRLLRECQFFPEDVCRFVFAEVLLGLRHLHELNILYRDLKAENVLVDLDGHCRLADFGLSKTLSKGHQRSYSFCGSPEYLSPEMLLGTGHDKTLDYYGIGCLLYEMLTGVPPHYSSNRNCMYSRIIEGNLSFPSSLKVSPEAKDLVERLLHVDPGRRLGADPGGVDSICAHPWLQGIDWKRISERAAPSLLRPYLQWQRLGIGRSPYPVLPRGKTISEGSPFRTLSSSDVPWEAPATCPFRHFDWENKRLLSEASERCSLVLPTADTSASGSCVQFSSRSKCSRLTKPDKDKQGRIIQLYKRAQSVMRVSGGAERIPVKTRPGSRVIQSGQAQQQPGNILEQRYVMVGPSGRSVTVSVAPVLNRLQPFFTGSVAVAIPSHRDGELSMAAKPPMNSPVFESIVVRPEKGDCERR